MAFAVLFALEMIVKWIALGIRYYFSSVWSALDFVIVMVSSRTLNAIRSNIKRTDVKQIFPRSTTIMIIC